MTSFTFVVLHYQTFTDTVECVDSILQNIDYKKLTVVIVNNGSTNNSGQELQERFRNEKKVHYVDSKENLGFAKGNNLGFDFAKHKLKSDFICLLNNDTLILQKDFVNVVVEKFRQYRFHILGPDIISTIDNQHQNPETETLVDLETTIKRKKHYKRLYVLNRLHFENSFVGLKRKLFGKGRSIAEQRPDHKEERCDVKLHGSCLIFSKPFIEKYDGLYPRTFMYAEESILNYIARRDGLVRLYSPELKIFHKEDSSTNFQFPDDNKKRRFYYRNLIDSMNVLIDLMREK